MLDVTGKVLDQDDRRRLAHPLTGGVILFTRNYESPEQLATLVRDIRAVRPDILIAVDHEGGRVQRFRSGFTRLPAMRTLGELYEKDKTAARERAYSAGYVLGAELRAYDIDLSFTPVLDIDYGESGVIGDRAFHRNPQIISDLAISLAQGLHAAGMASCGKHFPGHGFVRADSHLALPVDERSFEEIATDDLVPFREMTAAGMESVMPAHVVYPKVDSQPAGFSPVWLKTILRGQLHFDGVIFSDDLCMEGAAQAGGILARAEAALAAGCDMILVCNRQALADEVLSQLKWEMPAESLQRLARMRGRQPAETPSQLRSTKIYQEALAQVLALGSASAKPAFDPKDIVANL
jgi:beta-N-acetylhexosaminidase